MDKFSDPPVRTSGHDPHGSERSDVRTRLEKYKILYKKILNLYLI